METEIERDLFGEPVATPPQALLETLARADLIEVLAAIRLMAILSAGLRGDSTAAGWTILVDGLPAVFAMGMCHTRRKWHAALAGLIDNPMLELLSGPLPSEDAINDAMNRHAAELVPRWSAALETLESKAALVDEQ